MGRCFYLVIKRDDGTRMEAFFSNPLRGRDEVIGSVSSTKLRACVGLILLSMRIQSLPPLNLPIARIFVEIVFYIPFVVLWGSWE
jgi:hypothetical protein